MSITQYEVYKQFPRHKKKHRLDNLIKKRKYNNRKVQ